MKGHLYSINITCDFQNMKEKDVSKIFHSSKSILLGEWKSLLQAWKFRGKVFFNSMDNIFSL